MVAVLLRVGRGGGMSRHDGGRELVLLCEECHSKMLAMGELLLLACEARPVFTSPADLRLSKVNFEAYRDKVVDKLNRILIASRDVSSHVHGGSALQWKSLSSRVQELGALVTALTELSAHIGYLVAVNFPDSRASRLGVVNKYKLHRAKLELKFCCSRLKRSCVDDLDPHLLVDLCSTMSKALSSMTEVCRGGGERAREVEDQSQFKLCVKSLTSTTSCLIASVKRFKSSPSMHYLRRVMAFCDPVVAASGAVVTFASEEEFIGQAAELSEKATEVHKSVLGMSMSIVSSSIQMCKAVRDLVYDQSSVRHRERIRLCVDSTDKASAKLRDLLLSCDFEPKGGDSASQPNSASGIAGPESGDTKPGVAKNESNEDSNNSANVETHSRVIELETASAGAKNSVSDVNCHAADANVSNDERKSGSDLALENVESEKGSTEVRLSKQDCDTSQVYLEDSSSSTHNATNFPSSPSVDAASSLDSVSCSSLDSFLAEGDAHNNRSRLDLKVEPESGEKGVMSPGLATSPAMSLSTFSVSSMSDVDPLWASQTEKSSPS